MELRVWSTHKSAAFAARLTRCHWVFVICAQCILVLHKISFVLFLTPTTNIIYLGCPKCTCQWEGTNNFFLEFSSKSTFHKTKLDFLVLYM